MEAIWKQIWEKKYGTNMGGKWEELGTKYGKNMEGNREEIWEEIGTNRGENEILPTAPKCGSPGLHDRRQSRGHDHPELPHCDHNADLPNTL